MTPELKEAIQQAFINIDNTEKGLEIIPIYRIHDISFESTRYAIMEIYNRFIF